MRVKKWLFIFIIILSSANLFGQEEDELLIIDIEDIEKEEVIELKDSDSVEITKITVLINGVSHDSVKDKEKDKGSYTKLETVLRFLSLHVGQTLTWKDVNEETRFSEVRLKRSGYFYSANVYVVPGPKDPKKVVVLAEVTEGFLYRFGGGAIFGMFGYENLFGLSKKIIFILGWNIQEIFYEDALIRKTNLAVVECNYFDSEFDIHLNYQQILKISSQTDRLALVHLGEEIIMNVPTLKLQPNILIPLEGQEISI